MLIKTKLQAAPLRASLLFRKALIKRLSNAQGYPLIMISGPAGSGKTCLACQWIKREKLRSAWFSLDEEDNHPNLFFRYLLTTLCQADERLDKALGSLLDHHRELSHKDVIPHIIEASSTLGRNIYLILDDFHQIESKTIHTFFVRFIQYLPPRLHLVILSRYGLPDPIDAATLKKDRLMLGAPDLKFTEKETAALYRDVFPLSFSLDQIQALNQHVEGWAAGLQLIGISFKSQGLSADPAKILSQAHEQVASYLIHDILRMQPQKIRDFIFVTVLLDRFNPELCVEVTGMPDAAKILIDLERMNLFLNLLDVKNKWYRYHHVFSEVIRQQMAILDPDAIPTTLCKAALWLARNHYLEDALRCAFQTGDFKFAADLIEDYILVYIENFDLVTGLRWISKLPEHILNQRPLIRLQQCCFNSILGELSDVKGVLLSINKNGEPDFGGYSDAKRALCEDFTAYLKCMLHILHAGETAIIDQFQPLRDKFYPQNPLLIGFVETQNVFNLIAKGDLNLAESFFERISQLPLSKPSQLLRKKIYHAKIKSLIARHRGRLLHAEAIIMQVLKSLKQQGHSDTSMAFLLHRHLGTIFYLQNKLKKARECADNAVKYYESEYFGFIDEIMAGNELRLQLHMAAGEYDQVAQCLRQIHAYSIRLDMPRIAIGADAFNARIAIERNKLEIAELWVQQRNLQLDEPFSLLFAMESLTLAHFLYARGQYGKAAHLLEILRNRCIRRSLAEIVLKIDILQAAILQSMDHSEKAVLLLKKALAFGETEGYLRPFINNKKRIAPILVHIAEEASCRLSAKYLETILTACDIPICSPALQSGAGNSESEDLTKREIEILQWMSQGFQNKEISQKGCIAISTVKSHVSNILVKLNVKTRTQAILKARQMKSFKLE